MLSFNFIHKKSFYIFLSAITGFLVFSFYFDLTIADPTNITWIYREGGDLGIHYLGSYYFRLDDWHFPLTKTVLINAPEGNSIIFSDSNPLLSLIAKLLKFIFPPEFQLIGMWYLICWILQSIFGYLLIFKLTKNNIYALISGLLFCLLPTQVFRINHENLVTFWLILWTLYVYVDNEMPSKKKQILFFTIFAISSLIHAYITFMAIFISATWYIKKLIPLFREDDKKNLLQFLKVSAILSVSFLIFLWTMGYFYNNPQNTGLLGFGTYAMNLNAPFNPISTNYSTFIKPLPVLEGHYEGFQYWGMGIIILFFFIAILFTKKYFNDYKSHLGLFFALVLAFIFFSHQDEISAYERFLPIAFILLYGIISYSIYKENEVSLLWLIIPASFCYILALSNKITLGNVILFEFKLSGDEFYAGFYRTLRSSGRFFWVTTHILLLAALVLTYKTLSSKVRYLVICVVIIIQFLDLSKLSYRFDSNNFSYQFPLNDNLQKMIKASRKVNLLFCYDTKIIEFAMKNRVHPNYFYTAHDAGILTDKRLKQEYDDFKENKINDDDLYIFPQSELGLNLPVDLNVETYQNFLFIPPKNFKSDHTKLMIVKRQYDKIQTIIDQIKSKQLVLISAKDEATNAISAQFRNDFDNAFGANLRNLGFRQSYIAVFQNGKLVHESIGANNLVEYWGQFYGLNFYVKSTGALQGTDSFIKINNIEFSANNRGLNVVSLEEASPDKFIFNSFNFDTYEKAYQ
ncbi:DUF6311 domain-containing protein [Sporocytophaga myxococcoides]|uniref:DUF6311 domain-containing protein n=1 Tax=Sporocytophaga myxococcoides TaxID=153721 RepID=UPI00040A5BA1|nr:DUF6311 domain-containing protein [Sporocytophaga myxococcoides]